MVKSKVVFLNTLHDSYILWVAGVAEQWELVQQRLTEPSVPPAL